MRLTLKNSLVALVGAALLAVSSCSTPKASAGSASVHAAKNRKPAAAFTLMDSGGKSVQLADYRGKVVLLNFWATWCGPCGIEIPWFVEFEQQYKAQGFAVLGVSMDEEGWQAVKPFMAEHKINYRILLGNDSVSQLYGGLDALPTTFVIDRDGNVAFPPHIGLISKNDYVNEIQSLLETKQTALPAVHPVATALLAGPAK